MPGDRRADQISVVPRAHRRAEDGHDRRRVGAFRLDRASRELRICFAHIRSRAARRNERAPVAVRVRGHGPRTAERVRDDDIHIRQVRLADLLRAVTVRVEVKMPRDKCARVFEVLFHLVLADRKRGRNDVRISAIRIREARVIGRICLGDLIRAGQQSGEAVIAGRVRGRHARDIVRGAENSIRPRVEQRDGHAAERRLTDIGEAVSISAYNGAGDAAKLLDVAEVHARDIRREVVDARVAVEHRIRVHGLHERRAGQRADGDDDIRAIGNAEERIRAVRVGGRAEREVGDVVVIRVDRRSHGDPGELLAGHVWRAVRIQVIENDAAHAAHGACGAIAEIHRQSVAAACDGGGPLAVLRCIRIARRHRIVAARERAALHLHVVGSVREAREKVRAARIRHCAREQRGEARIRIQRDRHSADAGFARIAHAVAVHIRPHEVAHGAGVIASEIEILDFHA